MSKNNPYVGPRTFQKDEGDLFFGRDREARDLSALVATEKLVLFYAQSGAGKSSILNTRLIPELEAEFYEVLQKGRVSGELPEGVEVRNIYIYNLIRSLIGHKIDDPGSIASLTMSEFLGRLNEDEQGFFYDADLKAPLRGNPEVKPWRRALIIDQFEEIFSTSIDAWEQRKEFFQQLGKAMEDDPYLWIVLTMRDDYIAELDPYAYHLPGGLRVRYYMQRLGQAAAVKAVKSPAEKFGRPYADNVAERLVTNLASIYVKRTVEDKAVPVEGQFVEPVQLQVICQSLWKNLSDGNQITQADVDKLGDVDQALEKYYDERVLEVAKNKDIPERKIREWFERDLITRSKTRNMVLRNPNIDARLQDDVIQGLLGDLVRSELRAGQIWYELSHDRLIEPIIQSNEKWFQQHLSLFQRQVVLWTQQGRSDSLLLKGQELLDSEREAKALTLTPEEDDFLKDSKILRKREQRDRLLRYGIIAALVISLLFLGYSISAYRTARAAQSVAEHEKANAQQAEAAAKKSEAEAVDARDEAEKQKQEAENQKRLADEQASKALAGSLAAQANALKNTDHVRALLLGIEAYKREDSLLTRTTLFQLLQYTPYGRQFAFNGPVTSVAINPAGNLIASASCKEYKQTQCAYGEIILSNALTQRIIYRISDKFGSVSSLAFNEDGTVLATGGCVPAADDDKGCTDSKGQITLWNVTDPTNPVLFSETRRWHEGLVKSIAFSPDGTLLASGGFDKRIVLWGVSDPTDPRIKGVPLLGHSSFVNSLAFSLDGKTLVSAGDDRTLLIWDISNPNSADLFKTLSQGHSASISSIAFSPDGKKFASAGDDRVVILWDWDPESRLLQKDLELKGHNGFVKSVAFNEDGTILASAGFDNKVILWDTSTGEQIGPPLNIHTKAINAIAFGSATKDGISQPYLVSVSDDRTAIQWDLFSRSPLSGSLNLANPSAWTSVSATDAFKVGSQTLSFEIDGQTVRLLSEGDEYLLLEDFDSVVKDLYFDSEHLITSDENDSVIQWNINPGDWVQMACAAAKRNLDLSEWNQYLPNAAYEKTCAEYP